MGVWFHQKWIGPIFWKLLIIYIYIYIYIYHWCTENYACFVSPIKKIFGQLYHGPLHTFPMQWKYKLVNANGKRLQFPYNIRKNISSPGWYNFLYATQCLNLYHGPLGSAPGWYNFLYAGQWPKIYHGPLQKPECWAINYCLLFMRLL